MTPHIITGIKLLALISLFLGGHICAQTGGAPDALQVLSQHGPNLSSWALAPIEQGIPDAIRQNITFLREDIVDEGKTKPQASLESYRAAYQYCSTIIAVLDEREKMLLKAGYRAVQAKVVTPATNQALEARPVTDRQELDGWRWRVELPGWHLQIFWRCIRPRRSPFAK